MRTLVTTLCVVAAAWGGRVQAIRDPLHMLAWAGAWFAVSWMVHSPKRAKPVVVVVRVTRLLCWLGLHRWEDCPHWVESVLIGNRRYRVLEWKPTCLRCEKVRLAHGTRHGEGR